MCWPNTTCGKYIIKFFNKKDDSKFTNELNGYKFYSKNKSFKIPKLYDYSFKEKKLVLEYINGKKRLSQTTFKNNIIKEYSAYDFDEKINALQNEKC